MTTPEQINEQIEREDIIPYWNKVYDGDLPEEFVEQFRIAMMYLPVAAHGYSMKDVRRMAERRPNEVTTKEVGLMINVIYSIPFASMYQSLEEGVEKTLVFDRIREDYNNNTAAFERKVQAKKNRLLQISGNINSAKINGLKKS